jgi:F0F1-type ATP synthase assembly protein I
MKPRSPLESEVSSSAEGWVASGAFFGSILSGSLLGYLLDLWLWTDPWFVVVGIMAGSYSGFVRIWHLSKQMENGPNRGAAGTGAVDGGGRRGQ